MQTDMRNHPEWTYNHHDVPLILHFHNPTVMPAPMKKLDSEFNDEKTSSEMADTQAETPQQLCAFPQACDDNERLLSLKSYSSMTTKFVNNLYQPMGKYVTMSKQTCYSQHTYVQIYTHLKAYEPHAKKTLKKQEQSTSIVDPLAYVAHTTSAPVLSSPSTPSPQPTAQSPNDALMATMTQIANLLSGFQKQFPPTNNQLRTSSNSKTHATVHDGQIVTEPIQRKAPGNVGNTGARGKKVICYNCRGEGHVARQCKEPKRKMDSQYFKDKALLMEAKEKGDVLDAEAEAFLADVECTAPYDQPQALTTTNMFQANHEDAYDSDVDEGPNAAVAFMANLSSTSATNNPVNEVHSNDNQIFDNVDYQLSQEMHQEEHLDSDAETEIDDNTIPYHQYLLDTEAQNVLLTHLIKFL
ncbi:retrovirus-related pol polyprotein from transposon TNT 1-94 [Tanacetum coccineum]